VGSLVKSNISICRGCGCKLDVLQRVRGLCGDPECDRKDVPYQESKRREWLLATIRQQIPNTWNSTLPIALLPRNERLLAPLPETRYETHRSYLLKIVKEARTCYENGGELLAEPSAPVNGISSIDAKLPVLSTACGLCRGECCYTGGNSAWLRPATIQRQQWFRLGVSDKRIVDFYLSYLPVTSFEESCVYQGEYGCTLPRTLRANICNQFLCKELGNLVSVLSENEGTSCIAAAINNNSVECMATVDALGVLEFAIP